MMHVESGSDPLEWLAANGGQAPRTGPSNSPSTDVGLDLDTPACAVTSGGHRLSGHFSEPRRCSALSQTLLNAFQRRTSSSFGNSHRDRADSGTSVSAREADELRQYLNCVASPYPELQVAGAAPGDLLSSVRTVVDHLQERLTQRDEEIAPQAAELAA